MSTAPPESTGALQPISALPKAPPLTYPPAPKRRIRLTGRLVCAVVVLAVSGGTWAYRHFTTAHRGSNGSITSSGKLSVTDLHVGDCFNGPSTSQNTSFSSVTGVPCTRAHEGQVIAESDMRDPTYPSDSALTNEANADCADPFQKLSTANVPSSAQESYFFPTSYSFTHGDMTIVCALVVPSGTMTGSLVSQ